MVCVIFCGRAYALPQDWPCFGIEVEKYKTVSNADGIFEYAYKGEKNGYVLDINLSVFSDFPTSFANCGNSGCFGKITKTTTDRTEYLRFFFEEYNDDYTKVPEIDNAPEPAQGVAFDIQYNPGFTDTTWTYFKRYFNERNVAELAKQVHRNGISESRNNRIAG